MMNKKLKKLLYKPDLFFKDMYLKRINQLRNNPYFSKIIPITEGNHSFTVITAVYNVEKYLEQYFLSLTRQTLTFKKHISLILVDDGSTDSSAKIIKKWQKKYPNNIKYFYKENGGQASARNLGISHITGEWLTFIDPDDFISNNYFSIVDNILTKEKNLSMVSLPIAVYKEHTNTYHYDTTPLTYCFKDSDKKLPISNLKNKVQLSVCTAFFETSSIKENKLFFNENLKPCFEDGKFVTDYFLLNKNKFIYFIDKAHYFYRVRGDNSSTTNTQWQKKEKYIDVFEYGYLEMFRKYTNQYKKVPLNIQFTFLYFAIQYIKLIVKKGSSTIDILSPQEIKEFSILFQQCFDFIEKNSIMQFHLHGCNFFYKYGMINLFKQEQPNFLMVYLDKINYQKQLVEFYFYNNDKIDLEYFINDAYITPSFLKIHTYKFLDKIFLKEYRVLLSFKEFDSILKIKSTVPVKIVYKGKEYLNQIPLKLIKFHCEKDINNAPWVFIDKETKADDNAEHLYRYIQTNYPSQKIYFALSQKSSDWNRLSRENFNLLDFGSNKFEEILKASSVILSSHADKYFMDYFGSKTLQDKKFIFLQHGVIMHDLSLWLNNVSKINLFCTSTVPEYQFIGGINSPYKYTHEVKLTGLARHDALIEKSKHYKLNKNILIMPTWRNNIVGQLKKGSVQREINPNFSNTEYFKNWYNLLHSNDLKLMLEKYGYTATFIPHPNIYDYLDLFNIPNYIEIPSKDPNFSIQDALAKASFMITDYSSITFDMAVLQKTTLYYQFDAESFFSGTHTSNKGYFSYNNDGFGPISKTQNELLKDIEHLLQNNSKIQEPYATRVRQTFPNNNEKNCEKIYNAIKELDKLNESSVNIDILNSMIKQYKLKKNWELLYNQSSFILSIMEKRGSLDTTIYKENICLSLFYMNKFNELIDFLEQTIFYEKRFWLNLVNLHINAPMGINYFINNPSYEKEVLFYCLLSCIKINDLVSGEIFRARLNILSINNLTTQEKLILDIVDTVLCSERNCAINQIIACLKLLTPEQKKKYKLELVLFETYLEKKQLQKAHEILVEYEKHTKNDPTCRIAIARLAHENKNYEKVIYQVNNAVNLNLEHIPENIRSIYFNALSKITKN